MNLLAEEHSCFVVYPAQVRTANHSGCWNWFERADQQREQGEPALIAGITRQVCADYAIDTQRVFVAGLSAGGAMAVIMAITYPELYAAVGCHSGLPYGAAHDLSSALAAMGRAKKPIHRGRTAQPVAVPGARALPLIVFHGDQDTTVHPRNTDELIAQWLTLHADQQPSAANAQPPTPIIQREQGGAGHAYTRTIYPAGDGQTLIERWLIHGVKHAWSGGSSDGSFTSPREPDAARQMLRFFLAQPQPEQ
jgi:poly(hydroxyalkanoate) depolymerase family esterase